MGGMPRTAKFLKMLEADGGDEALLDRIAAGESVSHIMASYGLKSNRCFYWWARSTPERKAAFEEARRISAEILVDQAREILDTADPGIKFDVTLAAERAKHRRWMAEKLDKEQFGSPVPRTEQHLHLDLGSLHLDALRAIGRMDPSLPSLPPPEVQTIETEPTVLDADLVAIEPEPIAPEPEPIAPEPEFEPEPRNDENTGPPEIGDPFDRL